jgi:glycosyltransferase involved in cell wall biosynthesis
MSSSPLVSVLVTVYNRERYLESCLHSILSSTWQDFEVIVVDDGSTDGSVAIGEAYAAGESRIRFHRNDKNLGDYPNRMRAAELAKGKYLKYVDSDDLIYRHSLAIMVEAMESFPEAALGLSHSLPEDDEPYPWLLSPRSAWRKQFLGRGCLSCGPSGAIFRRDAFLELGGFRNWGVLNDIDLWCRLSARWPVLLLPPGLVWWRRHEGQEFTRGDAANIYLQRGFDLATHFLNRSDCPLVEEDRTNALARIRQQHARRILSLGARQGRAREAWQLFRRSGLGWGELFSGLKPYG